MEENSFAREYRRICPKDNISRLDGNTIAGLFRSFGQLNGVLQLLFSDTCGIVGSLLALKEELQDYHEHKRDRQGSEIQSNNQYGKVIQEQQQQQQDKIKEQQQYINSLEKQLDRMSEKTTESDKLLKQRSIEIQEYKTKTTELEQRYIRDKAKLQLSVMELQEQLKEGQDKSKEEQMQAMQLQNSSSIKINNSMISQVSDMNTQKNVGLMKIQQSRQLDKKNSDEEIFKAQKREAELKKKKSEEDYEKNQKFTSSWNYNQIISDSLKGKVIKEDSKGIDENNIKSNNGDGKSLKLNDNYDSRIEEEQQQQQFNENQDYQQNDQGYERMQTEQQQDQQQQLVLKVGAVSAPDQDARDKPGEWSKKPEKRYYSDKQLGGQLGGSNRQSGGNGSSLASLGSGNMLLGNQGSGTKRFKKQNLQKNDNSNNNIDNANRDNNTIKSNSLGSERNNNNYSNNGNNIFNENMNQTMNNVLLINDQQQQYTVAQESNSFAGIKRNLNLSRSSAIDAHFNRDLQQQMNSQSDDEQQQQQYNNNQAENINNNNNQQSSINNNVAVSGQSELDIFNQFKFKTTNKVPKKPKPSERQDAKKGYNCGMCKQLYETLGEEFCSNCSRHKSVNTPPHTPNAHYEQFSQSQDYYEEE